MAWGKTAHQAWQWPCTLLESYYLRSWNRRQKRGLNSSGRSRTWKNYWKKTKIGWSGHGKGYACRWWGTRKTQTFPFPNHVHPGWAPALHGAQEAGPCGRGSSGLISMASWQECPWSQVSALLFLVTQEGRGTHTGIQGAKPRWRCVDANSDLSAAYWLLFNLLSCGFLVLSWEEKSKCPQSSSWGDRAMEGVTEAPWAGSGKLGTH